MRQECNVSGRYALLSKKDYNISRIEGGRIDSWSLGFGLLLLLGVSIFDLSYSINI
jgi:hypothetical protein